MQHNHGCDLNHINREEQGRKREEHWTSSFALHICHLSFDYSFVTKLLTGKEAEIHILCNNGHMLIDGSVVPVSSSLIYHSKL